MTAHRTWLCLAAWLLIAGSASATTRIAASASASDVQAKIDLSVDGDFVLVPTNIATWSTPVIISNKAITVYGSGITATVITNGIAAGSDLIIYAPTNGQWLTVSGFRFEAHPTSGANGSTGMIKVNGDGYWRLCSNYLHLGSTGVCQNGNGGLFDHNYVHADYGTPGEQCTGFYHNAARNNIWLTTIQYGTTTNWTYIEHNTFDWDASLEGANGADDGGYGAASCDRYNTITNTWIGMHGPDSSGPQQSSVFGEEYYSNSFFNAGIPGNQDNAMSTRGGTGLFWGNTLRGAQNFGAIVKLFYYRYYESVGGWAQFPTSIDGWVTNSGQLPGWPGLMQPGFTGPIQGVDVNYGTNINGSTNCIEVSSPVYVWGNTTVGISANNIVSRDNSLVISNLTYFITGPPSGYQPLVDPYPLTPPTNPPPVAAASYGGWWFQ